MIVLLLLCSARGSDVAVELPLLITTVFALPVALVEAEPAAGAGVTLDMFAERSTQLARPESGSWTSITK